MHQIKKDAGWRLFYLVQMMGLDKILLRKILMLCSALACYKQDEIILNFSVASFTLANLSG